MDFPVWDAVTDLPDAHTSCAVRGVDQGQPELVSVSIWRDSPDGSVHMMSFNPSAVWQPRMMAFHVAGAFRDAAEFILRGDGQESSLLVDGQPVQATLFSITEELTVVASDDPAYCVAVGALRTPVPALMTADPSIWRAAVDQAVTPE